MEDRKEEEKSAAAADVTAGDSPVVAVVCRLLSFTSSLFLSRSPLLSSLFSLVEALWSHPTPLLILSMRQPIQQREDLWKALQFVLAQPIQPIPHTTGEVEEQERRKEEQRKRAQGRGREGRAEADWEEEEVEEVQEERQRDSSDAVELSPSVRGHAHRLLIRAMALRVLAVEVFQQTTLPSPLQSFLSSALAGAELQRWMAEFTQWEEAGTERSTVKEWAEQLGVDVQSCLNPQEEVEEEEEGGGEFSSSSLKGHFLLEVPHRLLFDDLIAAVSRTSPPQSIGPALLQSSPPPLYPPVDLAASSHPFSSPSSHFSSSPVSSVQSSALIPSQSPMSLSGHRSLMTSFLASLARLNEVIHVSARQRLLAQALHWLLQSSLHKHPSLLFPQSSPSPILLLEGLASSISSSLQHFDGSEGLLHILCEKTGLWLSGVDYFLASSSSPSSPQLPGRVRSLTQSILTLVDPHQRLSGVAAVSAVVERLLGLLRHTMDSLVLACQVALPPSLFQRLREQLQTLHVEREVEDGPSFLSASSSSSPSSSSPLLSADGGGGEGGVEVLRSLSMSALVLCRYCHHLTSVRKGMRSSLDPSSSSFTSTSELRPQPGLIRPLPRPLTFPSPAPFNGAFTPAGNTSALSPVQEGKEGKEGKEEGEKRVSAGDHRADTGEGRAAAVMTGLTHSLLTLMALTAEQTELRNDSLSSIPLLLQLLSPSASAAPVGSAVARGGAEGVSMEVEGVQSSFLPPLSLSSLSSPSWFPFRALQSLLSSLLVDFSALPVTSASSAQSTLRLCAALASSASGALLLKEEGLLSAITSHPILSSPHGPSSSLPLHLPSFSPYLPSGERDQWHVVWCQTVEVVALLLLHLPPTSASLHSVLHFLLLSRHRLHRCLHRRKQRRLSVGHLQELRATTQLCTELGRRLLQRRQQRQLRREVGKVNEGEVEGEGDRQEAEWLEEMRALLLPWTDECVHVLMNPSLLEERAVAVSREERTQQLQQEEQWEEQQRGGASSSFTSQVEEELKASPAQRGISKGGRGEESLGREEGEKGLPSQQRRPWRPLGRGGGGGGGAAVPASPLRSPSSSSPFSSPSPPSLTSPVSSSSARSRRSLGGGGAVGGDVGGGAVGDVHGGGGERGRKRPSGFIPGPPTLHSTSSFLLRSPIISASSSSSPSPLASSVPSSSFPPVTSDAAFTLWWSNPSDHPRSSSPTAEMTSPSLLAQRAEWSLYSVLRMALSFLLLYGTEEELSGRGGQGGQSSPLLSFRIQVVDVQPLLGSRKGRRRSRPMEQRRGEEEQTRRTPYGEQRWQREVEEEEEDMEEDRGEEEERENEGGRVEVVGGPWEGYDGLQREVDFPYDLLSGGETMAALLRRRPSSSSSTSSFLPSSRPSPLLSHSRYSPSLSYRPPLSLMVDFCRHCLHLLLRTAALYPLLFQHSQHPQAPPQSSGASLRPPLRLLEMSAAAATPPLPSSSPPSSSSVLPPPPPSLPVVVVQWQRLLELSLLLLSQQATLHCHRLLLLFQDFHSAALKQRSRAKAREPPLRFFPPPLPLSTWPSSAVPPQTPSPTAAESMATVASDRVRGVLEGYRERLQSVVEDLTKYSAVLAGQAPPPLERRRSALTPHSPQSGGGGGGSGGGGDGGGGGAGGLGGGGSADRPTWSVPHLHTTSNTVGGGGGVGAVAVIQRVRERMAALTAELSMGLQEKPAMGR